MSTLTAPFARIFRSEKRDEAKTSVTSVKKSGAKNDGLIARTRLGAWLNRPMTSFHLVVATAALLTTLGLIMVLSASGVESYYDDGSAWTIFGKQVLWVCVGLVGFYIALRTPVWVMRKYSFPVFVFTVILITLVLIPGIGTYSNGSRGWFVYAGLSMQPSELTKVAFAIWGAHLLASRRMEQASMREMLVPLVPAALIALVLIVIQPDLGQTVSLSIILLALLWYAGLPLKVFLSSVVAAVLAAAILAVSAGYRSDRVKAWLARPLTRRRPDISRGRHVSRSRRAVSSARVWGRDRRNGITCRTRTTTSSSPSSARSSDSSAASECSPCSVSSRTPRCALPDAARTRSCA
ncbi:Putative cell division protein FtsW [Mycobacteroides abscessus]|nr:Putative cell division protein FtsW [Mycobacteroides abscessus]